MQLLADIHHLTLVTGDPDRLLSGFTIRTAGDREVIWVKPDVPVARGIRRAEWTTLDLD